MDLSTPIMCALLFLQVQESVVVGNSNVDGSGPSGWSCVGLLLAAKIVRASASFV